MINWFNTVFFGCLFSSVILLLLLFRIRETRSFIVVDDEIIIEIQLKDLDAPNFTNTFIKKSKNNQIV